MNTDQDQRNQNREQALGELKDCQERTLKTLVPTIIAVGLTSIANRENFAIVTLISSFAILFSSSLYVASLAYKIFRNGVYLEVLNEKDSSTSEKSWNSHLQEFNSLKKPPLIIGRETTTVGVIYLVFSSSFILMFYEIHLLLTCFLGATLAAVAVRIFRLPKLSTKQKEHWEQVLGK